MPYVLGFTAGYVTLAVALVGCILVFALVYGSIYKKELSLKELIVRLCGPVFIAGITVLFYYLSVLIYLKKIVKAGSYVLADAVGMKTNVINLLKVIFHSFNGVDVIEQLPIITIGTIWTIVLLVIVFSKKRSEIRKSNVSFSKFCIGINVVMFIVSMGTNTPMGVWFYSILPILGQTHLTIRYLMITIPMLYLAFCILLNDAFSEKCEHENNAYRIFSIVLLGISFVLCLIFASVPYNAFDEEKLILELVVTGIVVYIVAKEGWKSTKVLIVWSIVMCFIGIDIFYNNENVVEYSGNINTKSLVYDQYNQEQFQDYLSSLDEKIYIDLLI